MGAAANVVYQRAGPADEPEIIQLLRSCGLPTEDLAAGLPHFFVAKSGGALIGCVGLELFGSSALFRSLAVNPSWRGRGLSGELWQLARREAIEAGVENIFLLTTTAEALFTKWGFVRTSRDTAPLRIQKSREFASLCPSSAAFMRIAAR